MPMQVYPWTLLNTTQSWSINFISSGTYSRHLVRFSLSGLPEAADLRVELDGVDLGWVPKDGLGLDRWHYDIHQNGGLSGGEHELRFVLVNQEREGVAQLCSAEILEFGNEDEYETFNLFSASLFLTECGDSFQHQDITVSTQREDMYTTSPLLLTDKIQILGRERNILPPNK